MTKLGVNIDHCATLRQARYRFSDAEKVVVEPDIMEAARLAESGGADSITAHLREDRRHMQDSDMFALRRGISGKLNMEMACNEDVISVALKVLPDYVCLVPENRQEVTTEGGLDLRANEAKAESAVARLSAAGIRCSMFIDPDISQVELARKIGANTVELHTGAYANAWRNPSERAVQLERLKAAAERAAELGLTVNSGHGINYENVCQLLETFAFDELNIGHTIVSKALSVGMKAAVEEMKRLIAGVGK